MQLASPGRLRLTSWGSQPSLLFTFLSSVNTLGHWTQLEINYFCSHSANVSRGTSLGREEKQNGEVKAHRGGSDCPHGTDILEFYIHDATKNIIKISIVFLFPIYR